MVNLINKPSCEDEKLDEALLLKLDTILKEHSGVPGALIPVLQKSQEIFGYLPEEVLKRISIALDKPFSEVAGVVSFYSFFSTVPRGKYIIRVCLGTACYVRGGNAVMDAFKSELGIEVGDVTGDKLFSLEIARCFGACGIAPVIMVNDTVHQRVKPVRVKDIINSYRDIEHKKG